MEATEHEACAWRCLQAAHFLPEARLAEVLQDLFGVVISTATLAGMTRKAARRREAFCERVRALIAQAKVQHLDETGFRIGGGTQWRIARECGVPLPRSLLERIRRRYDQLLKEALAYHLALRLHQRKEVVLLFLTDFAVPFTINRAERDPRMMKLRMKIPGCFRSAQGARDFATLRSVLSTARKQGRNRIEALLQGPDALLAALRFQPAPAPARARRTQPPARVATAPSGWRSAPRHPGCAANAWPHAEWTT